jgi:hypothetical protein
MLRQLAVSCNTNSGQVHNIMHVICRLRARAEEALCHHLILAMDISIADVIIGLGDSPSELVRI